MNQNTFLSFYKKLLGLFTLVVLFSGCQTISREPSNSSLESPTTWPQLSRSQWQNLNASNLYELLTNHSVDAQDSQGNTGLFYAAELNSDPKVFLGLIEHGADRTHTNVEGLTALHIGAAMNQNPQVVENLIESPKLLEVVDQWGRDPASFAILANNSFPVISTILHAEQFETIYNSQEKPWPQLSSQVWAAMDVTDLERFLSQGKSPSQRSPNGRTGLHFAALHSTNPELIRAMINRGFSVEARDSRRWTPGITAAVMNSNLPVTQLFYELGSSFETSNPLNHSVLHFSAIMNPNPQIIAFLVSILQTPDPVSTAGVTPLMAAAWAAQQDSGIIGLLQHGANVHQKDNQGRDILDMLQKNPSMSQTEGYWLLMDRYFSQ
jgi:ankyrin repeat protein